MHTLLVVFSIVGVIAIVAIVALVLMDRASDRGWNPFE